MSTNILITTEFTFNIWTFVSFFVGLFAGVLLAVLIYLLVIAINVHKSSIVLTSIEEVNKEDVEQDIKDAQNDFLKVLKIKNQITWDDYKNINFTLMKRIASRFYPNSKKPLGELTIQEFILLDRYLMDKLDELLNKFGLKHFRKMRINEAITFVKTGKKVSSSKIIKQGKKASKFIAFINVLNPVTWINKGIVEPTMQFILRKILTLLIGTVGQETYHIYSKDAFLDPMSDSELDSILKAIEDSKEEDVEEIIKKED